MNFAAPTDFSQALIDEIAAVVTDGRNPAQIREEIAGAFRVGYTIYKGTVIAVAGLRKLRAVARARLFQRMGSPTDPNTFKIQLDWIYLHAEHRDKGQLTRLIKMVLESVKGKPLFAIVRGNDELSREALLLSEFKPESARAETSLGAERSEQLFLRGPV